MKLGEVYFWETDQVIGREKRGKFQIFICPPDGEYENTFLYINSAEWFKDFKLLKANYDFLKYDSFVASNSAVTYSDRELAAAKPALVGSLSAADLKGLRDALIAAETMETRDLNRICKALASAL
jgi:hypothetical protein